MRWPGLFILLLLLHVRAVDAQLARPWQVHSFGPDIGLVEKTATFGAAGADGTIWFAFTDGLYQYDGYRWQHFTTDHGLPSDYVRCVTVTSDGSVWVGTDRGAGVFRDGAFSDLGTSGKLAGPSVRRIVEDPDGALWFCCDQWPRGEVTAGLTRFADGKFTTWTTAEGLPSDYVSDFVIDSEGHRFVLTNAGLAELLDDGSVREPLRLAGLLEEEAYVWSLVKSSKHGLLASTDRYLFRFSDGEWKRFDNSLPQHLQPKLVATGDGEVFTCTSGRSPIIYRWDGERWDAASYRLTEVTGGVDHLFEDIHGGVWIIGFERLVRWQREDPEWNVVGERGTPLLRDGDGGVWFTYKKDSLVRVSAGTEQVIADAEAPIREDGQGRIWFRRNEGLAFWNSGTVRNVDQPRGTDVKLMCTDADGRVWIKSKDDAGQLLVAKFTGAGWRYMDLSRVAHRRLIFKAVPDLERGVWLVLGDSRLPPFHLVRADVDAVEEIAMPDRAQVSDPPKVQALPDGTLLLYGFFGLLEKQPDGQWNAVDTPAAAVGQAWQLGDETWISCRGKLGGRAALMRRRDGVYETLLDRSGAFVGRHKDKTLFVASQRLIHVLGSGLSQHPPPIVTTPFLTSEVTGVVSDEADAFWIGVGSRSYRYSPDAFPPETEIIDPVGTPQRQWGQEVVFQLRGIDRYKPQGLERRYLYSTRFNGEAWSAFRAMDDGIRLADLDVGNHSIAVRAMDSSGQVDATPATYSFRVVPTPIQSRAWFLPMVIICLATMVCLAVGAFANGRKLDRLSRGLEEEVERKTSSLGAREREFRLLFEESQDAICLFDSDGRIQRFNSAANELLGISDDSSATLETLFAESSEAGRFRGYLRDAVDVHGERFQIRASSRTIDAIVSANARRDEAGEYTGHQLIIRDISPLVDLQKRLAENQKMEAVGRMAGGIAHDFNNFLAVVMYGAEFVKLNAAEDPAISKGVAMIMQAAERGRSLTSQIQTFSRVPVQAPGIIDLRDRFFEIRTLLRGVVPESVELDCHVANDLKCLHAEPHQIEQVIVNLAINACHAMSDQGSLVVRADNTTIDTQRAEELHLERAGDYVRLEVSDDGEGMAPETVERIFDPFFTTKPQGKGTGLGLAIVYGIVRQHQGQVCVESAVGRGTRFEILLPATDAKPDATSSNAGDAEEESRGDETVLLVEDERELRELVCRSLQRMGYNVLVAVDGAAAKAVYQEQPGIDAVISDIAMPEVTGIELVQWLRQRRESLPCLLISGYADNQAISDAAELGIQCLKKPFHPRELAYELRQILNSNQVARSV